MAPIRAAIHCGDASGALDHFTGVDVTADPIEVTGIPPTTAVCAVALNYPLERPGPVVMVDAP